MVRRPRKMACPSVPGLGQYVDVLAQAVLRVIVDVGADRRVVLYGNPKSHGCKWGVDPFSIRASPTRPPPLPVRLSMQIKFSFAQ